MEEITISRQAIVAPLETRKPESSTCDDRIALCDTSIPDWRYGIDTVHRENGEIGALMDEQDRCFSCPFTRRIRVEADPYRLLR